MKTRTVKTGLLVLVLATGLAMSSFTIFNSEKIPAPENPASSSGRDWEEYNKVQTFAYEQICKPLNKTNPGKIKMEAFSRCPSGHEAHLAGHADSVRTNRFVYGEVKLFRGCSPKYVCDFKVNVEKGIAQVKAKDATEYMEVSEWIANQSKPAPVPVKVIPEKQRSTEIKG